MTRLFFVLLIVVMATTAHATTITLKWDPSTGASGYRLYRSLDSGVTWLQIADITGSPPATTAQIQAEDGKLVIYRVSAYNANGEAVQYTRGAWFDSLFTPLAAAGALSIP